MGAAPVLAAAACDVAALEAPPPGKNEDNCAIWAAKLWLSCSCCAVAAAVVGAAGLLALAAALAAALATLGLVRAAISCAGLNPDLPAMSCCMAARACCCRLGAAGLADAPAATLACNCAAWRNCVSWLRVAADGAPAPPAGPGAGAGFAAAAAAAACAAVGMGTGGGVGAGGGTGTWPPSTATHPASFCFMTAARRAGEHLDTKRARLLEYAS